MKQAKRLFENFTNLLKEDPRVDIIFLTGSSRNKDSTIFSDLDLWVVFSSESNLNSFCQELPSFSVRAGDVRGIYTCTAHHYFIIYKPSIQIDLNLLSSAQFYSIRNSGSTIVYDRKSFLKSKSSARAGSTKNEARELLFRGYTSLERCASKYVKRDYFATVRFLERIREEILIPLFNISGIVQMKTPIDLRIEDLNDGIRDPFLKTYTSPSKTESAIGIIATAELLSKIARRLKIDDFKDYMLRFNEIDRISRR